jgi:putative ABC transport system permease protein
MFGGLSEGTGFDHLGDAVAGAQVPRAVGSTFRPFHGNAGEAGEVHAEMEYRITGRLAPTGTPWDRAILVPIEAVWDVHADHGDGEADHDGAEAHDHGHDHAHGHDHGHDHDHEGEIAARPVDETKLADGDNPGVPAIVVKPRSIADAYNLRLEYRAGDATLAVFPAEVLTRLYGTLGDARQVLALVAAGAQALVAAAILMVVAVHVLQRRRQIGALRAFGAPRAVVLAIVWLEAFAVLLVGLVLGFAVGYAAARVLSAKLGAASGIAMPVEFHAADVRLLLAFLIAAAVVTLLPAFLAYRQTPAQALRA